MLTGMGNLWWEEFCHVKPGWYSTLPGEMSDLGGMILLL